MQNPPEDVAPESSDLDEGGGPVKSFLEHLEDLRWMLLKSFIAIIMAMLVCFIAGNKLVAILTWPLEHARQFAPANADVPVVLGTNVLGKLPAAYLAAALDQTNHIGALRLVPMRVGTNLLLAAQLDTKDVPQALQSVPILKNYTPLGGFMVALKLALYGGLILASPFVLYFVGSFVLPALKIKERKILYQAVGFGSVLFFLGVAFCYFVLAGVALVATVKFSQWLGFGADEWQAEVYITFMCRFMIGMGLGFELPVIILTLVKIGLLSYTTLVKYRAYAIVANLVIAAVATPSADPFTMMLMAVPLQFLYEVSVIVAWYWHRRDERRQAVLAAQGGA